MDPSKKNIFLLAYIMLNVFFSSCLPVMDSMAVPAVTKFRNCTNDSLLVGVSYKNNIDSVYYQLNPVGDDSVDVGINAKKISLWNRIENKNEGMQVVLPNSLCGIDAKLLFKDADTCYFFLVKYKDAKNHSWDEIRAKKLYNKWISILNKDGEFDTNIKYTN